MRFGFIAQTVVERLAQASGRVPLPIVESFPPLVLARSIMAGAQLGIFDALGAGALPAGKVAALCQTDMRATGALLDVLESAGYVAKRHGLYRLTRVGRRWLSSDSPDNVNAYLHFNYLQWDWLGRLEDFVRTGEPVDVHGQMSGEDWALYQSGMASIARLTLPEVIWRVRLPVGATDVLSLGGGHGLAVALWCQRHPDLSATVLDLPEGLASAPPLPPQLAHVDSRIRRIAGDALTADLGTATYDVVYVANLLHHFDARDIEALAGRIAAALRPGGLWIIQDGFRERARRSARMPAALGSLYFALTSASGVWSVDELAAWQSGAGLLPRRPLRLVSAPGQGLQVGAKPRARPSAMSARPSAAGDQNAANVRR